MIKERIEKLRSLMRDYGIDAYIIVSEDYHASEYVGDYFKTREFISGFNGSAGTVVVTQEKALLWTDGRYFLQAEAQLRNTDIILMRMGEKDVPTISEYLFENLDYNAVVGFDGKTIRNSFANSLDDMLNCKNIKFCYDQDLVDLIWTDRPTISKQPVWELDIKYAGVSREEKLSKLRENMDSNADVLVLTALDEIAWLLNLRGNDVACTPVFLSYMIVEKNRALLFVHSEILSAEIKAKLNRAGVEILEYDGFYNYLSEIETRKIIQMDYSSANYCAVRSVSDDACVVDKPSPVLMMKAVKNDTEIANIRKAHIMDGVALCRFMYWLKNSRNVTELDAVEKLKQLRSENKSYVEESFDAIVAYGAHGAVVHYEPDERTNIKIEHRGLCLADTGGHYLEGSTDVTRTVVMGELDDEEKKAFTVVLKGHLALADAKFPEGVFGECLDAVAREPLWQYSMDYNHGTGHGVGYLLSVHEGPQSISWYGAKRINHYPLLPGMITSNEPGYYQTGKFGIRHENLVLAAESDNGYMHFETLTLVPFDIEGVDLKYMASEEIEQLNSYHKRVFDAISPYLKGDELNWLKKATEKI